MLLTNCPDYSEITNKMFWDSVSVAEKRIFAACDAGQCSDFEGGSGQSLELLYNDYVEYDWKVASGVLEEAHICPLWIEVMQELRLEIERFRGHSRVANDNQTVRHQVVGLNKRIAALNWVLPLLQAYIPQHLELPREIRRSQEKYR